MEKNQDFQCKYRYKQQLIRQREKAKQRQRIYRRNLYRTYQSEQQQEENDLMTVNTEKNHCVNSINVRNAEINREHEVFIDGDDIDSYLDTSDDSNDEIQMIKVYDLDEEEINPIARYSPENQLKEIPINCNKLWNDLHVQFSYKTIIYCSSCFETLQDIKEQCLNDKCQDKAHMINSELVLFDIAHEIRSVVARNYSLIKWYQENRQSGPLCDIVFGDVYLKKSSKNRLSLLLATDGKPLTVSTRSSVWPVVAVLAEIPFPFREHQRNMMLLGLWHSTCTPNVDLLLSSIVHDLMVLRTSGLLIDIGDKGMTHFEVDVLAVGGDLPARAKCNKISAHNGFYACTYCLFSGISCLQHRHVLYPHDDFKASCPPPRTQQHIDCCIAEIKRSRSKNARVCGVYGESPLSQIISIPVQSTLDYFHLALEIHLVFLLNQWKQAIPKPVYIKINQFLRDIKYPHTIRRRPINIQSTDKWKATQLRVFLLYAALPFCVIFLPAEHQYIFSLFFIYIRTLRFFKSREDIRDMKLYVNEYLSKFPLVFGRCNELYSVHALLHLCEQCNSFGALAFHSMFALESSLHHYSKHAHGHILRGSQIAYWHCVSRQLETINKSASAKVFGQDCFLDDRLIHLDLCFKYENDFRNIFREKFKEELPVNLRLFSRYTHDLILYHSLAYSVRHCSASYCVSIENSACALSRCFGNIIFFFEFKKQKFFFFEQMLCRTRSFSSFISQTNRINSWSDRINGFFSLVNCVSSSLCIVSCNLLRHKAIFVPFQKDVVACTEIEHELEHD
ncbi:unnamed protein product [Rotaria magnacalcarata]